MTRSAKARGVGEDEKENRAHSLRSPLPPALDPILSSTDSSDRPVTLQLRYREVRRSVGAGLGCLKKKGDASRLTDLAPSRGRGVLPRPPTSLVLGPTTLGQSCKKPRSGLLDERTEDEIQVEPRGGNCSLKRSIAIARSSIASSSLKSSKG